VFPAATVETISFGTPTGSACIALVAIAVLPEPPAASTPSQRPSSCSRRTSARHRAYPNAVSLAPFATRYAAEAMVCAVDSLATGAGIAALRTRGSAVDAAIAADAVLAVTHQHQCGLGGDLLALVHQQGDDRPWALNASGRAGSGADPMRLRAAGHEQMPSDGTVACVPVPGCVDGWFALHERFARLPLEALLEPARRLAVDGFAASDSLAAASRRLAAMPGAEDYTSGGSCVRAR
jgi:gamma-glutamyltranspeptidase